MKLETLKKGQGIYARRLAYGLCGALVAFGAYALWTVINRADKGVMVDNVPVIGEITVYNVIALVVFLIGMLLLHLFLNRVGMVDLLIDTEQEMKKVSWPSKKEVKNSTIVVVIVTFVMAMSLFGFDKLLRAVFRLVF